MEASFQRLTLRQTRRIVPFMFSMMLAPASERRSSAGKPRRLTVRISSIPSRMLPETPGASWSRRRARLRRSFSAFAASPSSHACRSALRTPACRDLGKRSMILRALWTWQRWIGVWRPKVLRIALESALAPSMTNSRLTFGSRPRSIRLSSKACATTAFSVAPSITPRGCLPPLPSTPTAASSIRSSLMWMPSIWMTRRSSLDRSAAIHSFMRAADSATKRRDTADLDTPEPLGAPMPPSGRRTRPTTPYALLSDAVGLLKIRPQLRQRFKAKLAPHADELQRDPATDGYQRRQLHDPLIGQELHCAARKHHDV